MYKAKTRTDNTIFAIKKIPLTDEREVNSYKSELELMQKLKSNFTVQMFHYWIEDNYYIDNFLLNKLKLFFTRESNGVWLNATKINRSSKLYIYSKLVL